MSVSYNLKQKQKGERLKRFWTEVIKVQEWEKLSKAKDLQLIRKCVRRMKFGEQKTVNGQIFEKAANHRPYLRGRNSG